MDDSHEVRPIPKCGKKTRSQRKQARKEQGIVVKDTEKKIRERVEHALERYKDWKADGRIIEINSVDELSGPNICRVFKELLDTGKYQLTDPLKPEQTKIEMLLLDNCAVRRCKGSGSAQGFCASTIQQKLHENDSMNGVAPEMRTRSCKDCKRDQMRCSFRDIYGGTCNSSSHVLDTHVKALRWNSEGRIGIDSVYQGEYGTLGLPYYVYRKDGTAVYHLCAQPCNLCGTENGVDAYEAGTDFANLEVEPAPWVLR